MSPFLQFALALALFIIAAKLGGYLSMLIGQPAVMGELALGILLGPSVLDIFSMSFFTDSHLPEIIHVLAEVGVLLLMFLAGLELHITDLLRSGKVSALAGSLGVILPLGMGTLAGLMFSMEIEQAVFLGLILSATSVSISAQTLMELDVLRSRVGIGLLGAAVFDDILVLLGLSFFTALTQPGVETGWIQILISIAQMAFFLISASAIGWWLMPRLTRWVSRLPISQGLIGFAFVSMLLFGWSAEIIGQMAAITGAFLVGLWLGRVNEKERIQKGVSVIAYSIFVPVFFINIGLSANLRQLDIDNILLLLVMILVAVVSKILGAGSGALLSGFTRREAIQLGTGMMSRGEVGLIVAAIGIEQGLMDENTFTAVVGVVIATTLITPFLLRLLFSKKHSADVRTTGTENGEKI